MVLITRRLPQCVKLAHCNLVDATLLQLLKQKRRVYFGQHDQGSREARNWPQAKLFAAQGQSDPLKD
ncbi:hypothetical protein PMG11_08655 [Penicillium brasilianum]|uniref:Uncharacterized protein n=1 Tax=Penicillium brasilianum TaxID=104259 RepID=A0A0F7TXH5_PENBI|nr:hypothetical protein PMG11_08655 [Penicillium brasilianum]